MATTYKKKTECIIREIDSHFVLVPLADNIANMNKMYNLNELGAYIWNLIDGNNSNQQIAEKIIAEYNVDLETAIKDVNNFILKISDLVEAV